MKQHFLVLDSFRGICACLVAMSHFNANSIFNGTPIFNSGSIYVDFFFVLSGFVIFANYEDRLKNGYSKSKFILLRLGRIYPLHFFVLAAFIASDLVQYLIHIEGAALFPPFSAPGETPKDILGMLFLIHSLNFNESLSFNGPSWSISVEFYTYILFAFILAYSGKYYRLVIAGLIAACAVWLYHLNGNLYAKLDYGIFRCIYGFACGAFTWELYKYFQQKYEPHKKFCSYHFTFAEIAIFMAILAFIQFQSAGLLTMFAPVLIASVILVFAYEGGSLSRILKLKPFVFVGILSYSIYMIHIFISGKFFALPIRLFEAKTDIQFTVMENGLQLYGLDRITGTFFELFYLAVVIACSFISFKLVEEPFRNWSRRLAKKLPDYPGKEQKIYGDAS